MIFARPHRIALGALPATARRRQAGFTLIELMIAMVVSAIVVLGIFAFSTIQQTTTGMHERNVRIQQALEGAMWTMGQDVRAAGMGHARGCTELRVWDDDTGQLVNPGGPNAPASAVVDALTGEPYWVLRDGFQAHWNSSGAVAMEGSLDSSSTPDSAADSFDVIVTDPSYVGSPGVFTLTAAVDGASTHLAVETSNMLDNTNTAHLDQVRQMFPPGTFVAVARTPPPATPSMRPELHGQCALLQVTGDVELDGGASNRWRIPIANSSGFNADLTAMFADSNGDPVCPVENPTCDDWEPAVGQTDNQIGASVVPLGRLRWSRYEIDYSAAGYPYLVRYDIIGFKTGDLSGLGGVDYPHCTAGSCTAPQLHLPGTADAPEAVAIGPMIEDMQVAVGCDGYQIGAQSAQVTLPPPDVGFEEVGPSGGPNPNTPNAIVDENAVGAARDADEWLGNAQNEQSAPDCVWYGTAEYYAAGWGGVEGTSNPPPAFRMSPQTVRITLTATTETAEAAGGIAQLNLPPVEDRPAMASPVGVRQRFHLSERFSPPNLRWRDPSAI